MTPLPPKSRFPSSPAAALAPALCLLLLAAACATQRLPQAQPAGQVADLALRRTQALYLYPERLDRRMLIGALEALEARFDPVRFEPGESKGVLWVRDSRAVVPLSRQLDPDEFRVVLGQSLAFVEAELGPDLDLEEDEDLELLALRGALGALDRYSTIFSGRGTEDFQIRFSGKLTGIGSRIGLRDGKLIAVRVFPDSPAELGGLEDGDAIMEIDGDPTLPLGVSEAVGRIRGEEGTEVLLTVLRGEQTLPVRITRGEVIVPSVEAEKLENGFGYARIFQVTRSTPDEFAEKVSALGEIDGLVLDLRGNSGGSMLASAALADMFVSRGTIVKVVAREDREPAGGRSRAIANEAVQFRFPVAVLVDGGTASAAEIFSGAIAPLPHVTLIGQTTFGKGLIQRVIQIPNENLLKLTVAEYRLSEDRSIHLTGIDPDIALLPISSERLARLANVPDESVPYLRDPGEDDRFPIEVGSEVLSRGWREAEVVVRRRANEEIATRMAEDEIVWTRAENGLPEVLPSAIDIAGESMHMVMGEPSRLAIRVTNGNDFAIPDAWMSLQSLADALPDRVVSLGTLEPGASRVAEIELDPADGLGADTVPVLVHVAAGAHPLATRRLIIEVENHTPEVEIEVAREQEDMLHVTLRNRGDRAAGSMRVDVPGSTRTLETLEPGAERLLQIPIGGKVKNVVVSFLGPRAQRQIEIPLPEDRVVVSPPGVRIERTRTIGGKRLRVLADSAEGLDEGWIIVDGEKRTYAAWDGVSDGVLELTLPDGDYAVRSMVKTDSGISVIDARLITEE
jgi:C-terminal peptidase prc